MLFVGKIDRNWDRDNFICSADNADEARQTIERYIRAQYAPADAESMISELCVDYGEEDDVVWITQTA